MSRTNRRRKTGRHLNGILLLDKPDGITSNAALQQAKTCFNAMKAGHTGSLDPIATGMLPICFGEATKISSFLLDADKSYLVTGELGKTSTTGDSEGEITDFISPDQVSEKLIKNTLKQFLGDIEQIPPMYSALKHKGERLYTLARQGIEVERKKRQVHIFSIDFIAYHEPFLELKIKCSKGTYIRTLIEDIGRQLNCGAYVTALRRLTVGVFDNPDKMVKLALFSDQPECSQGSFDHYLLPIDEALSEWPKVSLSNDSAYYFSQGQAILVANVPTSGWVRIFQGDTHFLGMGKIMENGKVAPKRLFNLNNP